MPPPIDIPEDEDYASSADSDFAPEAVIRAESSESSDEEPETNDTGNKKPKKAKSKPTKRKRSDEDEDGDVGFENSGDEGLIREGKKALKRRRKKGEDSDDGGEGGLVKTRSQRAQEKTEKKPLANVDAATVDVEAVWASMISGNIPKPSVQDNATDQARNGSANVHQTPDSLKASNNPSTEDDTMITIKRTYNFAGKVHTEEKTIPRDSAEARLYLETQPNAETNPQLKINTNTQSKPKRPTKKLRKSMFEPVLESAFPPRTDLHFGSNRAQGERLMKEALNAKKLNTVEKSKMDWAGFVDKEGIRDELVEAGKAKGSYIERRNFLDRVEVTRDEEARRVRMGV